MSETIKLNVINQTTDLEAADLVLCQHNAAAGLRASPVAWQVLRNIARKDSRPFEIPTALEVGIEDAEGGQTPPLPGAPGQAYELVRKEDGPKLCEANVPAQDEGWVEVRNTARAGEITASVYKSGRLLALKAGMEPGAAAQFQFHPHVYIGLASHLEEGEVLSYAASSRIVTRVNLLGVTSADIVMKTGDHGRQRPVFQLENIQ